jgi:hypothetical protein
MDELFDEMRSMFGDDYTRNHMRSLLWVLKTRQQKIDQRDDGRYVMAGT